MLYHASHVTRYRYQESVAQCLTEARIVPRSLPWQRVHESRIRVAPEPAAFEERLDYFGNHVSTFSIFRSHAEYVVTAESVVEVNERKMPEQTIPWEQARARLAAPDDQESLDASEFLFDSPFIPRAPEFEAYAKPSFTPGRPLAEIVVELSGRIYKDFKYKPKATSIDMPLRDVFRLRRGVCQDFAHVMIAALRSWQLPARYVSGYLRSGAKFQGAEASHAWVSAYIPGYGWLDVDPTNNVVPKEGHIVLAWGRDYGDVAPVKGISLGGGGQTVDVEVRVVPLEME